MTYRDDSTAEINRLINELAAAERLLRGARTNEEDLRKGKRAWMLAAFVTLAMLVFFSVCLVAKAPLSADTRRTAEEFCHTLAEQAEHEREQRESGR